MNNFTISTFAKQCPAHWSTARRWHRFHLKESRSFWLCIFPMILLIFWLLILICFISSAILWVWGFFLREGVKPKHFQSIFYIGVNYNEFYSITNRLMRHGDRFHSYSSFHPSSSQRPLSKQPGYSQFSFGRIPPATVVLQVCLHTTTQLLHCAPPHEDECHSLLEMPEDLDRQSSLPAWKPASTSGLNSQLV